MRGCWFDLVGEEPERALRIKVEDGAIYFPPTIRGKRARVQGRVETWKQGYLIFADGAEIE